MRGYAPQIQFDYAVVNDRSISQEQSELYRADGADQILLEGDAIAHQFDSSIEIVCADLLDESEMVRHNSKRLAQIVIACATSDRARRLAAASSLTQNIPLDAINLS